MTLAARESEIPRTEVCFRCSFCGARMSFLSFRGFDIVLARESGYSLFHCPRELFAIEGAIPKL